MAIYVSWSATLYRVTGLKFVTGINYQLAVAVQLYQVQVLRVQPQFLLPGTVVPGTLALWTLADTTPEYSSTW
jgi:hypothetical protein